MGKPAVGYQGGAAGGVTPNTYWYAHPYLDAAPTFYHQKASAYAYAFFYNNVIAF